MIPGLEREGRGGEVRRRWRVEGAARRGGESHRPSVVGKTPVGQTPGWEREKPLEVAAGVSWSWAADGPSACDALARSRTASQSTTNTATMKSSCQHF